MYIFWQTPINLISFFRCLKEKRNLCGDWLIEHGVFFITNVETRISALMTLCFVVWCLVLKLLFLILAARFTFWSVADSLFLFFLKFDTHLYSVANFTFTPPFIKLTTHPVPASVWPSSLHLPLFICLFVDDVAARCPLNQEKCSVLSEADCIHVCKQ